MSAFRSLGAGWLLRHAKLVINDRHDTLIVQLGTNVERDCLLYRDLAIRLYGLCLVLIHEISNHQGLLLTNTRLEGEFLHLNRSEVMFAVRWGRCLVFRLEIRHLALPLLVLQPLSTLLHVVRARVFDLVNTSSVAVLVRACIVRLL